MDAPEAWAADQRGRGARIAVLDAGVDADHPDLAPNINTALSTSFVEGQDFDNDFVGFDHGSHVAGTVAAADNGVGVIGVAPQAEIVAVKVLNPFTDSGTFEAVSAGIVYAADVNADIINTSLGVALRRRGFAMTTGRRASPLTTSSSRRAP